MFARSARVSNLFEHHLPQEMDDLLQKAIWWPGTSLGRYTHRVAVSNERIVRMDDGKVTFRYRDYRDGNQVKLMTLGAFEFIRRFLLYILLLLLDNFVKIMYYDLLNNRNRKAEIRLCKEILKVSTGDEQESTAPE